MRKTGVAALFATPVFVIAVAGCGSGEDGEKKPAAEQPKAITLNISTPAEGEEVKASKTVLAGTVDPPSAIVRVNGEDAAVTDGRFSSQVDLEQGANSIGIHAEAPGYPEVNQSRTVSKAALTAYSADLRDTIEKDIRSELVKQLTKGGLAGQFDKAATTARCSPESDRSMSCFATIPAVPSGRVEVEISATVDDQGGHEWRVLRRQEIP